MQRQRVAITVVVDLDPIPGTFHTHESAANQIEAILISMIPHYSPVVIFEPED